MSRLTIKSRYDNAAVQRTWEQIRDIVSERDAFLAVERAVTEMTWTLPLYGGIDAVAWGWSGGKDSLALQVIAELVGLRYGVCVLSGSLEFNATLNWVHKNLPAGIDIESVGSMDLLWLRDVARPNLFPHTAKTGYFWTMAGTRTGQKAFIKRVKPRLMIYGRRIGDNNQCGDAMGLARGVLGVDNYNPIRNWSHELTLAVISYYWMRGNRTLPPIYSTADGWTSGTGPWPGRHYPTEQAGWEGTFAIEPQVVYDAAEVGMLGATEFLEARKRRLNQMEIASFAHV